MRKSLLRTCFALACLGVYSGLAFAQPNSILESLQSVASSTVPIPPAPSDLNPYGVAFVPDGFPSGPNIAPGDVLVSNFNNSSNQQGTGTTIVSISPIAGQQNPSLFAISPLIGLTTALGVLSRGFVIVGNLPVAYPSVNITPGSLQVFDRNAMVVATLNDPNLDSPWDLTINDLGSFAQVFVSNVLSGTVTRLDLAVGKNGVTLLHSTRIGSGFTHHSDPAALVVGPTGLAYDPESDTLFVASTGDNEIFGIPHAAKRTSDAHTGSVVFADQTHLHGPLGLTRAPNGNLITANGDAPSVNPGGTQNDLVEFTEQGMFVADHQLDSGAPGAAFGIASAISRGAVRFAAVDDDLNAVIVWTLHPLF